MATSNLIIQLISELTALDGKKVCCSEGDKRRVSKEAQKLIWASELDKADREAVYLAIGRNANPTGWHYGCTGIGVGVAALKDVLVELDKQAARSEKPAQSDTGFNRRNLHNLVSDGCIFSVEFIKRTDGQLRKMVCRVGVKKHLKGGEKAYDAKQHDLLTVFDMEKSGYRSIPVESIQRLSVNGQTFNFAGV